MVFVIVLTRLTFEFIGSYGDVYEIVVNDEDVGPSILCSCHAGRGGRYCRHRLALLSGDHARLRAGHENLRRLRTLIAESPLANALQDYLAADAAYEAARDRRRAAARALGHMMTG